VGIKGLALLQRRNGRVADEIRRHLRGLRNGHTRPATSPS
jgi:hypothetical protein